VDLPVDLVADFEVQSGQFRLERRKRHHQGRYRRPARFVLEPKDDTD
jgi:hypothetical protein